MAELSGKAPNQKRRDDLTEAEEALQEDHPQGADAEGDGKPKKNALPEIPVSEVAQITCQADLDAVIKAHQGWIASVFDPKADMAAGRANLKGADLRSYKLDGVNLSGANLEGANLQGVEAIGINLTATNLRGALLQAANLQNARLTRAKIEGADLRGADLTGATLIGVDLTKAIMRSAEEPAVEVIDVAETAAPELPSKIEGATKVGPGDADEWDDEQAREADDEDEFEAMAGAGTTGDVGVAVPPHTELDPV